MSIEEQKMLVMFLRLSPKFFSEPGEDAHEFFIAWENRFRNLGLVETCSMDDTTF